MLKDKTWGAIGAPQVFPLGERGTGATPLPRFRRMEDRMKKKGYLLQVLR